MKHFLPKTSFTVRKRGFLTPRNFLSMPGVDVNGNEGFYIMLVDLNATSNLNATFPSVRVDYSFAGLHGTAAFHVYGYIKSNHGFSWTNRVDGDGANGYYVTAPTGST